ncbi:nose resistant to fluoxetine protein 6-like isoform X1 [Lycorma delicatula]|uniref:nose resistant to fluoxetine protein 6-like isoform X1 n=1 Tax=Lycorma delicatula TaxID=130591 RepID=UPI003F51095C
MSSSKWNFIIFIIYLLIIDINVVKAWDQYRSYYYNIIKTSSSKLTPSFIVNSLWEGTTRNVNISKCHNDTLTFKNGVFENKKWALKMLDSSTQLQSGFLEGNIIDYGNMDECINIKNHQNGFSGQMCRVLFIPPEEENIPIMIKRQYISMGLCLPSSCHKDSIAYILHQGIDFFVDTYISNCVTKDDFIPSYSYLQYSIITFFITLISIIIISTICDICASKVCTKTAEEKTEKLIQVNKETSTFEGIIKSFSLYSNANQLLQKDENHSSVKSLHGLRFFSACGVLCVHRHLIDPQPFTNFFAIINEIRQWYRLIVFNAYLWVDVFFLMSGLLISYNFLKRTDNKKRLNLLTFYFHRYIRLTPPLLVIILIVLMIDHMCNGPQCHYLNLLYKKGCEKNWWATLTYINNIYDQHNMCIITSWYLSADMQMYVLSPILLYPLMRWPRFIFVEVGLMFLATVIYVFCVAYIYELRPTFIGPNIFYKTDAEMIYNQFYARAGPWLIGFALGILLPKSTEETKVKLPKICVIFGWILAVLFCTGAMFGEALFIQQDYLQYPIIEPLYKAFYRNFWALGFAWIIYACHTGHGGWVNNFLSSYMFHPLSRISYSFYLVHIIGQFLQYRYVYVPRHYSDITQFSLLAGDVVIAVIFAVILHLTVEAPTLNLEKLFTKKQKGVQELEANQMKKRIVKEA